MADSTATISSKLIYRVYRVICDGRVVTSIEEGNVYIKN